MYYCGIDYHKKYSVVTITNKDGKLIRQSRINHCYPEKFRELFEALDGPVKVVYESSLNWSWLYEILERIECIQSITLANAYKVRLIAEAQIKTDKIDSRKLAMLLRLGVVPCCHIPDKLTRNRKEVLRQRAYWVKQRTAIRNRIHKIINKQHDLNMPQVTDIFGKKGKQALYKAILPEPDNMLLKQNLVMLEKLDELIKADEVNIKRESKWNNAAKILSSIPGFGLIMTHIIATETDGISRFSSPEAYTCYSGLAPTTHSSGGKTYNGKMMWQCNKWLKWAFIEAAWVAIGCSAYFGGLYRHHRARGKKANTAITIVARRMCRIVYRLLNENRLYQERNYTPAALVEV